MKMTEIMQKEEMAAIPTNFTWIPFYMEFADKLLAYKEDRTPLVEKIKTVYANAEIKLPKLTLTTKFQDIDPFTVFSFFNKGITKTNRIKILREIASLFDVSSPVPETFEGIPVVNNLSATFYLLADADDDEVRKRNFDTLWNVFSSAIAMADRKEERELFIQSYDQAIRQDYVHWNLTMGLYWIRPEFFINLDATNRFIITNAQYFPAETASELTPLLKHLPDAETYLRVREICAQVLQSGNYPYTTFPELSHMARTTAKNADWEPFDYDSPLTEDEWLYILHDESITNDDTLALLKRLKDAGEATCTQLAEKYGRKQSFYNEEMMRFGNAVSLKYAERIGNYLDDKRDSQRKFIAFQYKMAKKSANGIVIFKLRDELSAALDAMDLSAIPLYAEKAEKEEPPAQPTDETALVESPASYTREDFLADVFMSPDQLKELMGLLDFKQNIILQGAPGVGKTFAAKRLAYLKMGVKDDSRIEYIQFHQNYSYEDFIMGYKPEGNTFALKTGVFYDFCKKAEKDPDHDYFFLIDEINRGNLSKIFGELLMLLEKDYRGEKYKIRLAYSNEQFNEKFYIPENLYFIGMMNTADRSLALIDYALRRRFGFYDMAPGFETEQFKAYRKALGSELFDTLLEKVKELNEAIAADASLGKGFLIGHSHFCGLAGLSAEDLAQKLRLVVKYDLLPTLSEYWFDDEKKRAEWANALTGLVK